MSPIELAGFTVTARPQAVGGPLWDFPTVLWLGWAGLAPTRRAPRGSQAQIRVKLRFIPGFRNWLRTSGVTLLDCRGDDSLAVPTAVEGRAWTYTISN
jgi:hypothetical protein